MTEFIQSFGVLAPIIYVLMFMFLPVFFFPVPILKKKMTPKQHDRIFNVSDEKLMMSLVILRLIPLVPYNMINYGYGLTNISLTKYMIASVLGIIPGTVVFLNFGATSTNVFSKEFLIASLLVILLTVGSIYLSKLVEKREQQKKSANE